jgi:uncharacterized Zn finger protein
MSWRDFGWRPYVPVAQRRANAAREVAKLTKKTGRAASPVVLSGRVIATTFWGKAWCDNLEAYSDFANRLPRGRTYVRNGSVVDLHITRGRIAALVSGSELYHIGINIAPLPPKQWGMLQKECSGGIDSVLELLQGRLSSGVMQVMTQPRTGLFPSPKEIALDCSCPDWADLCKHVAAVLYGVGARLDENPALLFELRGVDPAELVSQASAAAAVGASSPAQTLTDAEVSDVFGIEIAAPSQATEGPVGDPDSPAPRRQGRSAVAAKPTKPRKASSSSKKPATRAKLRRGTKPPVPPTGERCPRREPRQAQ